MTGLNVRKGISQLAVGSFLLSATALVMAAAQPPLDSSVVDMVKAERVSIEVADKILRARMEKPPTKPAVPRPVDATSPASAASVASGFVGCTTSSQPIEIITLAASLKCDLDLIFEYVYNNIEYEPLFGSNKGALGTLLDQRGNDIDQAQLFIALISAAGYAASQINLQYGYIRLNGTTATGWLGVQNDGEAIESVFISGGIPVANKSVNKDGTLATLDVAHVWVQVQIGGVNYVFDPSFKQHTVVAGLSNLATILGYAQSEFLSSAGGTIDSVSISNINRVNLRNKLASYANNLITYVKSNNPGWSMNDVVGGKSIQYLSGSPLRQTTLPHISPSQPSGFPQNWGTTVPDAYRTCFTISMPGVAQTLCGAASSQTIKLFSDAAYGQRITIFSSGSGCAPPNGSCTPTLMLNGAAPPNGQNTGTAGNYGTSWAVNVAITHPYTGSLASGANQAMALAIAAGGSYLLSAGWGGQTGRGMIEKHRKLLIQAQAAGGGANSEAVLGESLAVISYTSLAENSSVQRLVGALTKVTIQWHHSLGIAAQTEIETQQNTQGPYVDFPLNFFTAPAQTYSSSGFSPLEFGAFFTHNGIGSSLESAVLEQTQALVAGIQAASTVRLVDMNAATGAKTFFADGTTSTGVTAYFNSIRPNLTSSYSDADLAFIDSSISTNGQPSGKQVLIPANGDISVGLWHGAGYTILRQTATALSAVNKITGGLSGGFVGSNVDASTVAQSTRSEMQAPSGSSSVPAGVITQTQAPGSPKIAEPIAAITGAYLYQNTDLVTGNGIFPHALAFARNYASSSNAIDVGLGNGWTSNYSIAAARSSDPFSGLGETSPIAAAAAIAAIYVSQDLLSGTKNAQVMTLGWMISRWLTDQLTNNAVMITWPDTNETFTLLPRAEGATKGAYAAPLGSGVLLTGTVPDAYGNFTTFTYRSKDQTLLSFNPVDATGKGSLASWTFPNGMSVSLAYNYTHGGTNYLSGVTNSLGRSLTMAYSANHLISVTDDSGRKVAYGYDDAGNLTLFSDPIGYRTTFAYWQRLLTQLFYPSNPSNPFVTNVYDDLGRVSRQADANGNVWDFHFAGSRTETIDAAGHRHVTYQTPRGKVLKDAWVLDESFGEVFNDTAQQNGVVNVAANQYDGQDRLTLARAPEGGTIGYSYSLDLKHNVVQVTQTPKPGSPLSALNTTYAYDPTYNKPTRTTDPLGRITQLTYDPRTGNLSSIMVDAGSAPHFNLKSVFSYTGNGQVLTATDPTGMVSQFSYDARGNLSRITRDYGGLNQRTTMHYDAAGDVTALTDPNGNITRSNYDRNRRLSSVTSPPSPAAVGGLVTRFGYDPDGRVVQTQQVSGALVNTTKATYTLTGKLATATDANGNVTRYGYDELDRLASVRDALGRTMTYTYDAMNRQTAVFNTAIQTGALLAQTYTPDGLLASLTDASGNTTNYAYDGLDRLSTTTYPGGSTEGQTYDANGNVLTRTTRASQTITYTYDTLNRLATKTPPSPAPVVSYAYDRAGRVIGVSDTSGSVVAALPPSGTTVQYAASATYDSLNRPLGFSFSPAPTPVTPSGASVTFTHGYNAVNQRISQAVTDNTWMLYPSGSSSTSYSANALNQYTAIGAIKPTYDANGNLTADGTFTFGYDAENRLASASGAGNTVSYAYDAQGRRKSKTVNGTTTVYVTDADNREILEYNGSTGQIQVWNAYGAGLDGLNRMDVVANARQTLIPDLQGSVIATLASNTGALTKRNYLPFGEGPTTAGSFAYTGLRIDPETSGLYYARARIYSPRIGRFVQPDPIGYASGMNLYAYVGNNPLNFVDLYGLAAEGPTRSGSSYPVQVACAPLCPPISVPGFSAPAVGAAGTPGYQAAQQQQSLGGYEAQFGLQTGIPPTLPQQIGNALGGFVSGAASGAQNLWNLIFNQAQTPQDILLPGGVPIGKPNRGDETTRNVQGGEQAAQAIFGQLTQGGVPANKPSYPGAGVILPGGGFVGYRPGSASKSGVPAIDVNIPGIDIGKLHFP